MAVFKCNGRIRFDTDGEPYCTYEAAHRWLGRCPGCGRYYNCDKVGADRTDKSRVSAASFRDKVTEYIPTGVGEFDKVIGGGLVAGSTILMDGTRGAGKSSLLVGVCDGTQKWTKRPVLYASGEESAEDVGKICRRMKVDNDKIEIMGDSTDIDEILARAEEINPALIVLDSLQVTTTDQAKGDEASAIQAVSVMNMLTSECKKNKWAAIVINHMNALAELSGTQEVQHLVDTIARLDRVYVYDEDDNIDEALSKVRELTILEKNRNGREDLKGYFEMTEEGLLREYKKKSKLELLR